MRESVNADQAESVPRTSKSTTHIVHPSFVGLAWTMIAVASAAFLPSLAVRQFQRCFSRQVGVLPKLHSRILSELEDVFRDEMEAVRRGRCSIPQNGVELIL
jgi:hypothetical protein